MAAEAKKPILPEWAMIAMLLGGGGAGVSALGLQSSTASTVSRSDLAEKVDQKDLDKLEASVDALARAVMELTIEVRSGRTSP